MSGLKKILMMANQAEENNLLPEGYAKCKCLVFDGYTGIMTPHIIKVIDEGLIVEAILQARSHGDSFGVAFDVYKKAPGMSLLHYDKGWTLYPLSGYAPYSFEKVQIYIQFAYCKCALMMNDTLDGNYTYYSQAGGPRDAVYHNLYIGIGYDGSDCFKGDIYDVKVYDLNSVLLSHYIPALRTADGKAGMYDVIRNEFLTSITRQNFSFK